MRLGRHEVHIFEPLISAGIASREAEILLRSRPHVGAVATLKQPIRSVRRCGSIADRSHARVAGPG
jgi:hypothetical protein